MRKTIAIVCGGDSSEHDVSMRSAQGIAQAVDAGRYETYVVELSHRGWHAILDAGAISPVDRNDFSFQVGGRRVRPDLCYITIHGTPGENGVLQGYFDLIGMPYSTSGVLVEALTFNKFVFNNYVRALGVTVADSLLIRQGHDHEVSDEDVIGRIGLPCFVKPVCGGSSFGTSKVSRPEQLRPAIALALAEKEDVLIEAFMPGTELTCGCYKTSRGAHVLPVTEVVPENEFFDYDAKYNGRVSEITPARISPRLAERVQTLTSTLYDILGCRGIVRADYIVDEAEHIRLLEINTTPGMTATSFIPQQVRAAGMEMGDVLTDVIEDCLAAKA